VHPRRVFPLPPRRQRTAAFVAASARLSLRTRATACLSFSASLTFLGFSLFWCLIVFWCRLPESLSFCLVRGTVIDGPHLGWAYQCEFNPVWSLAAQRTEGEFWFTSLSFEPPSLLCFAYAVDYESISFLHVPLPPPPPACTHEQAAPGNKAGTVWIQRVPQAWLGSTCSD
jgi:hypothetical protein